MYFSVAEVYMVGAAALWNGSRSHSVRVADEDYESSADSVRKEENEQWGGRIGRGDGGNAYVVFFLMDMHILLFRR